MLIDDKNLTFENQSFVPAAEQGVANALNSEKEIINFETNENPEFKIEREQPLFNFILFRNHKT